MVVPLYPTRDEVGSVRVGYHTSIAGGVEQAVERAVVLGCNTFQMFTRNPRRWGFKALDKEAVLRFQTKLDAVDVRPVFVHMPYLPNLASPRGAVYEKSVASLLTEVKRCERLAVPYLVTHLGSHLGTGKPAGLRRIVAAFNETFRVTGGSVTVLLENTAGTRNSMGSTFADLVRVIDGVGEAQQLGVCFDTAHAFAAGYDLRSLSSINRVFEAIDSVLGWGRLKLVHLNDTKGALGSGIDRHEHIGLGKIGEGGFANLLHTQLRHLPMILETPVDARGDDRRNLLKVRELARDDGSR
jgi:deoxyribonuclease-4